MTSKTDENNASGQGFAQVNGSRGQDARRRFRNELSRSGPGRILLHAFCLLRRPGNARWHCLGIGRELVAALSSVVLTRILGPWNS